MIVPVAIVIAHVPERAELLLRALESVKTQTWEPMEIIVQVALPGEGAAETRNRALEKVTQPWIAWLDDDDELLPRHIEVCYGAALETGADLIYPGGEIIGGRDPLAVMYNGAMVHPFGIPFGAEQEHHLRFNGNFIPVTLLVRTQLVRDVGGFPIPFSASWPRDCEDYGLLIRLLDRGARFHHVAERTWRYFFHEANTGGQHGMRR